MTIVNEVTGKEYESLAHALADELGGKPEDYQSDLPMPDLDELEVVEDVDTPD